MRIALKDEAAAKRIYDLEGEAARLRAFGMAAWAELKFLGPEQVFLYERLKELAIGAGLEDE